MRPILRNTFYTAILTIMTLPAGADHIEELVITASHDTRSIDVAEELLVSPDVAQLLREAPGANVNSNGPLTGIPQYRGMYGPRVATSLDGVQVSPSGPNWMDPPLSYAVGGQLESLEIHRGIAPVSVAQESIGGAVTTRAQHGNFTDSDDFRLSGRVIGTAQSVTEAWHANTAMYAANQSHRLKLAAMAESGDDVGFPDGDIRPTEYERERYDLGYGARGGRHTLQLDYGYNDTGDSGTPALPMDIETIEGDLYRLAYDFDLSSSLQLSAVLFANDLDHEMTNFHLRQAPPESRWRRNVAGSDSAGFTLKGQRVDDTGSWTFGVDGFDAAHDSDIENPNNPMFFVRNFNDAQRAVYGVFAERRSELNGRWQAELGLRYNRVEMDADTVDGTPAMMGAGEVLRDAFNKADRGQNDNNVDAVAKAWYRAGQRSTWYAGFARKTRSPSHQERYLWLPLEATAGLADGYTYTGNIELDPEVSHQVEFGLDFSDDRLTVSPRVFYSRVDDYIQGTPSEVAPAVAFVRMMNRNNGSSNPDPLQFNNIDAVLYGFDVDWSLRVTDQWIVSGLVNYVRGRRDDGTNDELYRIAPANATLRLDYIRPTWSARVEGVAYAEQDEVSEFNNEQETSGYGVVNAHASWQASPALALAAGVQNLFDRDYEDHLAGYNRAANPDIPIGARLPGYGTSLFARVTYEF